MTGELFVRKYFWTVNLFFIFLVASVIASTGNAFLEVSILPMPKSGSGRSLGRLASTDRPAQLILERIASLTGLPLPIEKNEGLPPPPPEDYNSPPVKTTLKVKLLGTLFATKAQWSIASILDLGTQRAETYMEGDRIQGAEILDILRDRVIIFNNRRREFISSEAGEGTVAYTPPEKPVHGSNEPVPSVTGSGIHALSENSYEVPRSEIDKTLSNLNDIAMQARIVPAFKDGQAQGFKLFSIRPDSLYTKIGIQNGDVIRRINGYDLNSPEKALEVYSKLREANRIDIQIERNGTVLNKTYNIH